MTCEAEIAYFSFLGVLPKWNHLLRGEISMYLVLPSSFCSQMIFLLRYLICLVLNTFLLLATYCTSVNGIPEVQNKVGFTISMFLWRLNVERFLY